MTAHNTCATTGRPVCVPYFFCEMTSCSSTADELANHCWSAFEADLLPALRESKIAFARAVWRASLVIVTAGFEELCWSTTLSTAVGWLMLASVMMVE